MTTEQNDFLTDLKRTAHKYLLGYLFTSVILIIGFYVDTKVQIGALRESQQALKEQVTEIKNHMDDIFDLHLSKQ